MYIKLVASGNSNNAIEFIRAKNKKNEYIQLNQSNIISVTGYSQNSTTSIQNEWFGNLAGNRPYSGSMATIVLRIEEIASLEVTSYSSLSLTALNVKVSKSLDNILYEDVGEIVFSEISSTKSIQIEKIPLNKTLILHDGEYKKMVVETKATPIMTSSTTPSGIVTQSSSFSEAYDGWKIFSEDLYDASGWNTPYNVSSGWVSYKFESPVTIVEYNLRPRYNAPSPDHNNILQMANTWNLEGSNDGIDWIVLDYQTGHTWKQGEVKGFKVQSIGSYFYYRINVLSNNVTSYGVAIGRLNLFQDNGWLKVSSTLPTQQQFQSDGMNSLSPLLDRKVETLEPMQMQSKSDILPVDSESKVFSAIVDLSKYLDIRSMKVEVR